MFKSIPLDKILVTGRLRQVDDDYALAIQASIIEHGLLHPITVRKTPAAERPYTLVAGATRYRAVELLEHSEIDAVVVKGDALDAQLIEVAENLHRNDLSVLDRSVFVQTYRDVWERKHGEIKPGPDIISDNLSLTGNAGKSGFSEHVADRLGLSKRSIERLNRIAQNLHAEVRKQVSGTPIADNQSQLLKLAKLEPKKQRQAAMALEKTDGDFSQAMTLIDDNAAAKKDRNAKLLSTLISTWSRAGKPVRDEFLKHIGVE